MSAGPAALLVFAKLPVPGAVKTRLTGKAHRSGSLSEAEAAALAGAFLRDALDAYATLPADVRLYLDAPPDAAPAGLAPGGVTLHEQRGEGLGQRMLGAFVEAFLAGYGRVVVIGADHPTLPLAFVRIAFDELEEPLRIVLGPSDDGGYYLLGTNELRPALFEGMAFSHGAVFEETLARAQAEAAVTVLPPWYDVDTPGDLRRLADELDADPDLAPNTREVLAALRARGAVPT